MAKKKTRIPDYKQSNGYYRTRIQDENGKQRPLYAKTKEELYKKELEARKKVEEAILLRDHPTVAQYCDRWLQMRSATVSKATMRGYSYLVRTYIIKPMGDMYMSDVTADDIRVALVAVANRSSSVYASVNMLVKSIFGNAERSELIEYNPTTGISARGGVAPTQKEPLTDEQVQVLLDAIRGLRPYVFIMIGLYAGLRREEILGLQWDCVFLDASTPYISVRRAWRTDHGRPEVTPVLKTPAARRDIPIPPCLVNCLREAKESSISEYVIADSKGNPLSYSQFDRLWKYVKVRSTKERVYYKYVNGESVKITVNPAKLDFQKNNPKIKYTIDFDVTPHTLRHTYVTNLLYEGVDPKTVQYLAGHENSKTTMDIYAKVKYNRPAELRSVINSALNPNP